VKKHKKNREVKRIMWRIEKRLVVGKKKGKLVDMGKIKRRRNKRWRKEMIKKMGLI